MTKKILSIILSTIICISPLTVSAESNNTEEPTQTIVGYLTSDSGETIEITGYKLHSENAISNSSTYSNTHVNNSCTYEFCIPNLENIENNNTQNTTIFPRTGINRDEWDPTGAVHIYLKVDYNTINSAIPKHLLTKVSGSWTIYDPQVAVLNAKLDYGCVGAVAGYNQIVENIVPSNPFNYNTGFSTYIVETAITLGAHLKMDLMMGSRNWSFTCANIPLNNGELPYPF